MSAAVLKFILNFVAKEVWQEITKNLFKPEPNPVDAILGGQAAIKELIQDLDYKEQIRESMNDIYYWTGRMQDLIDDMNRTDNSAESVKAYEEMLAALRSESSGIRLQTFALYIAVVGDPNNKLRPEAMLSFWAENAYKKLADASNMKYFMQDYVNELDTSIAAVIVLLHHGLALSFYVALDEVETQRLQDECVSRVNTIRDTLYNIHYPPALRQFKPAGYDDTGLMLTNSWFNFYKDGDDKHYMTIYDFWVREVAMSGGSASDPRSFEFVAADATNAPIGALEMHARWADNSSTRIKYYDDDPEGLHREYAYTNSLRSGKTYAILFKLIPFAVDEDDTSRRTPVRLIPYAPSIFTPTRADQNNTFGNTWKMVVTTSPH